MNCETCMYYDDNIGCPFCDGCQYEEDPLYVMAVQYERDIYADFLQEQSLFNK